jgi:2'-5' RNA ligase
VVGMESKPYDIALLPSDEIKEKAIDQSGKLSRFGSLFTLAGDGPFPHISIYMFQLKADDIGKVEDSLRRISSIIGRFELITAKYFEVMNYIDVEYQKTMELEQLQDGIIKDINPLRDGMRANDQERLKNATGEAKTNLEKYGTMNVYSLFRPHLTFTRFTSEVPGVIDKLPDKKTFDGYFDKLGLFELGEEGTCIKEVYSLKLTGNT